MTNETPKIYYLYKIFNLVNYKVYIGQSINTRARWYQHKKDAGQSNPSMAITQAIKKYGNENFTFEVIASCRTQDDANELETLLVKQYESHISTGKGYNVSYGGMNAPKSEEWKRKVSEKLMGHEVSPEAREKMSKSHTGLVVPDEVRQKIKIGNTGKEVSEETRQLLSKINMGNQHCLGKKNGLGYRHTPEALQKISEASKKRPPRLKGKTWKLIDGKRVWIDK